MLDWRGRPLVEVTINGRGPYRFILDTGASGTVIGMDLREELGLPAVAGVSAVTPSGVPATRVQVEQMRMGKVVLKNSFVAAMDLSGVLRGADAPRGVLSAASFSGHLLIFDYPGRRIQVRKGQLGPADGRRVFEYTAADLLPTVPLRVAGREIPAHIDSGASAALTLPSRYKDELPLRDKPVEAGRARTVSGETAVYAAGVAGAIVLGEYELEIPQVRFADIRAALIPGKSERANIGYEVLRRFVVTMDSLNRRIRFD